MLSCLTSNFNESTVRDVVALHIKILLQKTAELLFTIKRKEL